MDWWIGRTGGVMVVEMLEDDRRTDGRTDTCKKLRAGPVFFLNFEFSNLASGPG